MKEKKLQNKKNKIKYNNIYIICPYCKTNDELYRNYDIKENNFRKDTYQCLICDENEIAYNSLLIKDYDNDIIMQLTEIESFNKNNKFRDIIKRSIQD